MVYYYRPVRKKRLERDPGLWHGVLYRECELNHLKYAYLWNLNFYYLKKRIFLGHVFILFVLYQAHMSNILQLLF